eukprot:scaffold112219_cov75-Phaeocystis_antarctica.AAC.1
MLAASRPTASLPRASGPVRCSVCRPKAAWRTACGRSTGRSSSLATSREPLHRDENWRSSLHEWLTARRLFPPIPSSLCEKAAAPTLWLARCTV